MELAIAIGRFRYGAALGPPRSLQGLRLYPRKRRRPAPHPCEPGFFLAVISKEKAPTKGASWFAVQFGYARAR